MEKLYQAVAGASECRCGLVKACSFFSNLTPFGYLHHLDLQVCERMSLPVAPMSQMRFAVILDDRSTQGRDQCL